MAILYIPSLLRKYTEYESQVIVNGQTVGEAIIELDRRFPGIGEQLVQDDQLRPTLSLAVDGHISRKGLRHKLTAESEVRFLPHISGGS
jgi:molybdopterin converting factor small subunit